MIDMSSMFFGAMWCSGTSKAEVRQQRGRRDIQMRMMEYLPFMFLKEYSTCLSAATTSQPVLALTWHTPQGWIQESLQWRPASWQKLREHNKQ
jgi:hypothetical protein